MIRSAVVCVAVLCTLSLAHHAFCGEVVFPATEAEIVEALAFRDGEIRKDGVDYRSEGGKVYKIIQGKRFRVRGLRLLEELDMLPRAGALVRFDRDSATIRAESRGLLEAFAHAFQGALPNAVILITGHTDATGDAAYNQALSERRGHAVAEHLCTRYGIASARFTVKGYGETRPIADNDTESGRALNRRVEFVRLK